MIKNLIIYHQVKPGVDCSDGVVSAWVVQKYLKNNKLTQFDIVDFYGDYYQNQNTPSVEAYHRIFVVDFSYPAEVLLEWHKSTTEIFVLDHHKTAMESLSSLESTILGRGIRFDLNECGATLTWKFFFPEEPVPAFLEYVKDRDLWDFLLPSTKEIHAGFSELRYKLKSFGSLQREMLFAFFDELAQLDREDLISYLAPVGTPLIAEREAQIKAIASRHEFINFKDNPDWHVPIVRFKEDGTEDRLVSDVCMVLYRQYPNAPFSACYLPSTGTWSLRSDKHGNDTDVGEIAQSFGGGGHRNAAGMPENAS